jgi:16S rRNA (uracil1498-N3)-methyltransferase
VVERNDRAAIAGFFCEQIGRPGERAHLPQDVAHHAHVRRIRVGERVHLFNGRGSVATAAVESSTAKQLIVDVVAVEERPRPAPLEVVVPVADRDRMLLAAEKCVELQITSWRPAVFARSRSVSPRGEGPRFRQKLLSRMTAALEQSGGGWLPDVHEERDFADAIGAIGAGSLRLLMDAAGTPIGDLVERGALAIAVGPEGGMEETEIAEAARQGWLPATLGETTMRFETAIIAGVAIVRALQLSTRSG